LNGEFALFVETDDSKGLNCVISLIYFDSFAGSFKKIRSYQNDFLPVFIHVDVTKPTRFVMVLRENRYRICNITGHVIDFGEELAIGGDPDLPFSIHSNQIYYLTDNVNFISFISDFVILESNCRVQRC
jgi:hypothetical protein